MSNFQPAMILPNLSKLKWLQGSASELTHDVHLLLLIQPNCPGCHMHALPLANNLMQSKRDFDVYCVSTAFEDFEFNTIEAAQQLLNGKHVGVAKERLGETAKHVPVMPFAHDVVVPTASAPTELKDLALSATKNNARKQMAGRVPEGVLEKQLSQVGHEVLPEFLAEFFYTVNALGTPTWVLHKSYGEVLDHTFGQMSETELMAWIDQARSKGT